MPIPIIILVSLNHYALERVIQLLKPVRDTFLSLRLSFIAILIYNLPLLLYFLLVRLDLCI